MLNENYTGVPSWAFIHTDVDGTVNTVDFEAVTWPEALEKFIAFLQGCQYLGVTSESVAINSELHGSTEWSGNWFEPEPEDFSGKPFPDLDLGCVRACGLQ